ncbi:MAG: hypothetical protein R3B93_09835 [Bacteroidia bacterium]
MVRLRKDSLLEKVIQRYQYALLGNRELAVDLLKQAFEEGFSFGWQRYSQDVFLKPLFGYEPFEEFVRTK